MRKGESSSVLGTVLIQLLIAAFVLAALWFPFGSKVVNMTIYHESAHATDNAMLIDAMHVADRGTMRATYFLTDPRYTVRVAPQRVQVVAGDEGQGVTRRFAIDEGEQVQGDSFTPRVFQWVREGSLLRAEHFTTLSSCPPGDAPEEWRTSAAMARGPEGALRVVSKQVLDNALPLAARTAELDDTRVSGGTELAVLADRPSGALVAHGQDAATRRLACLVAEELFFLDIGEVRYERDDEQPARGGITVHLPGTYERFDRQRHEALREALERAYERMLGGES